MKAKKAKIAHGTGVTQLAYEQIRKGKTNEQTLEAVMKKFPESRLGIAGVSWCRNKLRKDGEKVKKQSELKGKTAKTAKPAAKKAVKKVRKPAEKPADDLT